MDFPSLPEEKSTALYDLSAYSWMERWYDALQGLTIPSTYFRLNQSEVSALLGLFDNKGEAPHSLLSNLDAGIHAMGGSAFVRLGSRSPKDTFAPGTLEVKTAADAVAVLAASERILDDLVACQNVGYDPYLFVRKWISIDPGDEFRCFVKDRELKAISQYHYTDRFSYLDHEAARTEVARQATGLLELMRPGFERSEFIYDMMRMRGQERALLIEINPWRYSDPCLFDWTKDPFEHFEFRYNPAPARVLDDAVHGLVR